MSPESSLDPERLALLHRARLAGFVRAVAGDDVAARARFTTSPLLAAAGLERRGWALLPTPARLGAALMWAVTNEVTDLTVAADATPGIIRRRAEAFRTAPDATGGDTWTSLQVRDIDDPSDVPAPEPHLPVRSGPEGAETLTALLVAAGADIDVSHGVVTGHVRGLEVARIVEVDALDDAGRPDGTRLRLDVGIGRHDRDAFSIVHGDVPLPDAVRSVVDTAQRGRRADNPAHPLGRIAAERWLRSIVVGSPAVAGCTTLTPIEPIEPIDSVKDLTVAAAWGVDDRGRPTVVACSVGIDVDLVPVAADLRDRERHRGRAVERLVIVLPERDCLASTETLAARLSEPAEIVTVPDTWRTMDEATGSTIPSGPAA